MAFSLRFGPDAVRVLDDELAFQGHFRVRRLTLQDGAVVDEEALFSELDMRIRDVRQGPDGLLYLLTD